MHVLQLSDYLTNETDIKEEINLAKQFLPITKLNDMGVILHKGIENAISLSNMIHRLDIDPALYLFFF